MSCVSLTLSSALWRGEVWLPGRGGSWAALWVLPGGGLWAVCLWLRLLPPLTPAPASVGPSLASVPYRAD